MFFSKSLAHASTHLQKQGKLLAYHLSHLSDSFASELQYMLCYLSEMENIPALTQRFKRLIKHST